MNITMRALVTTPSLTVQHMKDTDSGLRKMYRERYKRRQIHEGKQSVSCNGMKSNLMQHK